MRVKSYFKTIAALFCAVLLMVCSSLPTYAFVDETELPHIVRWVNGAPQSSNGTFLHDTWAVDDTEISENKYVLINQNSEESMRIKNYPDDISNGETISLSSYSGSFVLYAPKDMSGEVIVTFESDAALYTVSFNEDNSYKNSVKFLPGAYKVTDVEVLSDVNKEYYLQDDILVEVKDKDFSVSLNLNEQTKDDTDNEEKDNGILSKIDGFDENDDLGIDTLKLFIAIIILFAIYSYIKYKRNKAEEINK